MQNNNICVKSTLDYSIVQSIAGNRTVNPRNVEVIKESMKVKQLIVPAILNEKMEIIDGQHRYNACRDLELPFYYIIVNGYSLEEVQMINANMKNWTQDDFLDSFVNLYNLGDKNYSQYAILKTFIRDTGVPLSSAISISDLKEKKGVLDDNFKHGRFSFKDYEASFEYAEALRDFEIYEPKKWCSTSFINCYAPFYFNESIEHARMVRNVPSMLDDYRNASGAKVISAMLVELYNFRLQRRERIDLNPIRNEWMDS